MTTTDRRTTTDPHMTDPHTLTHRARLLRSLHEGDDALVLPNAWDAASAALVAKAGARAVATTSGGVAWALGRADGQRLTRTEMADAVGRIAAAVEVPVTADVEGGYGPGPEDVAATVRAVLDAGAVGINLEDSTAPGGPLFTVEAQTERIRAARAAAEAYGVPEFVLNARTDVFLFGVGEPGGRAAAVTGRARAYAEAGADCLFVPGLLDLDTLRDLAGALSVPVNAMARPGGPGVAELSAAGVRRVSVGTGLAEVAYGAAQRAAADLLASGGLASLAGGLPYAEADALFG